MNNETPELLRAVNEFNRLLVILDQMLTQIELKNGATTNWFVFASMIGRKYSTQLYSLQRLFEENASANTDAGSRRLVDASSLFVMLRMQLETFAVFHHLFIFGTDVSEKIVRFRLWELDGIRTRAKYTTPEDPIIVQKLEEELMHEKDLEDIIRQTIYFSQLSLEKQAFLLDKACWRFTDASLQQTDKNKRRLSIEQLTRNTGLKPDIFQDWYSIYSMYAHTGYFSVVQQEQDSEEEQWITKFVALQQSIFMTCFLLKDYTRIFASAKDYFHSLTIMEQEAITSREQMGRLIQTT